MIAFVFIFWAYPSQDLSSTVSIPILIPFHAIGIGEMTTKASNEPNKESTFLLSFSFRAARTHYICWFNLIMHIQSAVDHPNVNIFSSIIKQRQNRSYRASLLIGNSRSSWDPFFWNLSRTHTWLNFSILSFHACICCYAKYSENSGEYWPCFWPDTRCYCQFICIYFRIEANA